MKRRFDDVNLSHYDMDSDDIEVELMTAKRLLQNSTGKLDFLHHVYEHLLPIPKGFPMLLRCLKIAMTFGVTSAAAERSFSSLRRIKTYLRSTMGQERLYLSLLYIERELSGELWNCMDDIVLKFVRIYTCMYA